MFSKKKQPEEPAVEVKTEAKTEPVKEEPTPPPVVAPPATIGSSILIRGDISGEENLTVEGKIEGTVTLKGNALLVGPDGDVNATVKAGRISVSGRVEGDLQAEDQVVLQSSGKVQGNITAPRVTLEDGCKFKGTIDMDMDDKVKAISPTLAGSSERKPPPSAATGTSQRVS